MTTISCNGSEELTKRLRKLGAAVALVSTISVGGVEVLNIQASAFDLLQINNQFSEVPLFVKGKHFIEELEEDCSSDEPEYTPHALAFTFDCGLKGAKPGARFGNLPGLVQALSEYEMIKRLGSPSDSTGVVSDLITSVLNEHEDLIEADDYPVGFIWVQLPSDPVERSQLTKVLEEHSAFFAFPSEHGALGRKDIVQGKGLSKIYT